MLQVQGGRPRRLFSLGGGSRHPFHQGAGRAAPVTRARSEEPVVEERRRRRKRRTSGETRGRAVEEAS